MAKGAKISNNSYGGGGESQAFKDALSAADNAGHLFVAAAGNSNSNNDRFPHYPSSYDNPNVISVAATDDEDDLASFSNYGANSVDLGAPGVGILSTVSEDTYDSYNGTSMATPHVVGVAALIKSKDSGLDDGQIKERILESVEDKGSLEGKTVTGGRLNGAGGLGLIATRSTELALTASPTLVDYEGETTLTGELSTSSGPIPDKTVTVWRSTDGGSTWTEDGEATYDAASETYKATRSLTENATFQLRFAEDPPYKEATSPNALVEAHAYLSEPVVEPNPVQRDADFTVEGYLKPYHSGSTRLYFFYYYQGQLYYVGYVAAPNESYQDHTRYRAILRLAYPGTWVVVPYHSDESHAATYTYTVFQVS